MKKYFLALPLVFAVQLSNAQTNTNTKPLTGQFAEENLKSLVMNGGSMARLIDTRYAGVKGTPFFLKHFGLATISMFDNKVYDKIRFNYNVMDNALHYKDDKEIERVLPNSQISTFILADSITATRYMFINLNKITGVDSKHTARFSQIIFEGQNISLAMTPEKELLKADYKGGYTSDVTHDEIVDAKTYYIIKNKTTAEKVKLNKKNLVAIFSDKNNEIESYLKKEKIDASTETGWIKTISYFESL